MLNDFLKLITQESIATIEGLLGQTPDISHLEEKTETKNPLKPP